MTERSGGTIIFCRILAPPQCPPPHTSPTPQYLFILMGVIIFCRILAPPPPMIHPQTPQYLTILRTERGRHYVYRILAPSMPPPPTTPQYLTILMTERGGAIIFIGFWRPPPPQMPQYLTILMTERGRHYVCRILAPPMPPPPTTPQYLTILMTERGGRHYFLQDFGAPSPDITILNYFDDREGGGGNCNIL